jgi:hypothetical protein
VISNHSLEHFEGLEQALDEIRRVIDPNGFLYIAVPDSSTVTDRIYRWMAQGGGQVNSFTSASVLVRRVSEKTGLPHAGREFYARRFRFLIALTLPGEPKRSSGCSAAAQRGRCEGSPMHCVGSTAGLGLGCASTDGPAHGRTCVCAAAPGIRPTSSRRRTWGNGDPSSAHNAGEKLLHAR